MLSFSFIHVADIHLGKKFSDKGLSNNVSLKSVNYIFSDLVDFAIEKSVDFIFVAGDTFDSAIQDLSSKLLLKKELEKLEKVGIKTFLICGNHDPLNSYNKNTFNFGENSEIKIIGLNTSNPYKTILFDKNNMPCASLNAFSFEQSELRENPTNYFTSPNLEEIKLFNIGLLHCDLNASKDSPYAPCSVGDLKKLNYDYWALGHIHQPCLIEENIIYSGTLQSRNSKEIGIHGFRFVVVDNGKIKENNFIPFDVARYETIEIDLSPVEDEEFVNTYVSNEIFNKFLNTTSCENIFLEVTLTGAIDYYFSLDKKLENFQKNILESSNNRISIFNIKNMTVPQIDYQELRSDIGLLGEIVKTIEDEAIIEETYLEVNSVLEKEFANCFFTEEEKLALKQEVLKKAKENCLNESNQLYNKESDN